MLGLNEAQRDVLRELMADAPLKVFSRLSQAEKLEQAIARDLLDNAVPLADLQPRLDELAALKRGATEAQIATINRMQALLSKVQFRELLEIRQPGRTPLRSPKCPNVFARDILYHLRQPHASPMDDGHRRCRWCPEPRHCRSFRFQPDALRTRAKAAGAPVEVDIGKLAPGDMMIVEWRGKPVWISIAHRKCSPH